MAFGGIRASPLSSLRTKIVRSAIVISVLASHLASSSMTPAARRKKQRGSLYDASVAQFSPDGSIQQVEYARVAVRNSEPVAAVVLPHSIGVSLAARVRPRVPRRLLVGGHFEKIFQIDSHVFCVVAGIAPDGASLIAAARQAALEHRTQWGEPIPIELLAKRVSNQVQAFTQYGGNRPFGVSLLLAGWDSFKGVQLIRTDPSGNYRVEAASLPTAPVPSSSLPPSGSLPVAQPEELVVVSEGRDASSIESNLKEVLSKAFSRLSATHAHEDSTSTTTAGTGAAESAGGTQDDGDSERGVAGAAGVGAGLDAGGGAAVVAGGNRTDVIAQAHAALERVMLGLGDPSSATGSDNYDNDAMTNSEVDPDDDYACHLEVATLLFLEERMEQVHGETTAAAEALEDAAVRDQHARCHTKVRIRPVVVFGHMK